MKLIRTKSHRGSFEPLCATGKSQAAMMTLAPGESSDEEFSNEHPRSEQWLYVISGRGTAAVGRQKHRPRQVRLSAGALLVIEQRELHQITNSGTAPLRTLNIYVPPAYQANGALRASAKRG